MAKKPVKPAEVNYADKVVNQSQLAKILNVTTRWLREKVAEGVVPTEGRNRYRIGDAVAAYIAYSKEGGARKSSSPSNDVLKIAKAREIEVNIGRKDRTLITLEEALGVVDEITGLFVSSLAGLPARITGVPRERHRIDGIFDTERQRLADRCAERRSALRSGTAAADPTAEDDAA